METRTPKISLDFGTKNRRPQLGNAYVHWHSIPVSIRRYFTTVDGAIIDKTTAPAALQVEYPFFTFGEFDRQSGYNNALKALPPVPGTYFLTAFVNGSGGTSQQITGFTGFNTVKNYISNGDIVLVYTDNINAPNYFVWLVIKNTYGGMASIVGNSETTQRDGLISKVYLEDFKYFTDNSDDQWMRAIHFTRSTNIATFEDNQVMPYIFKNPYNVLQNFIDVGCRFNLDQFQSVGSYFGFDTEQINWDFRLAVRKTLK